MPMAEQIRVGGLLYLISYSTTRATVLGGHRTRPEFILLGAAKWFVLWVVCHNGVVVDRATQPDRDGARVAKRVGWVRAGH